MTPKRLGFSLIEMLIVMAILAAATTIAIRATSGLQSQARYQSTTRSLTDVQNAILGPSNERNPDGTPLVSGFVADMGRLPVFSISASDPLGTAGDPLNELLQQPASVALFSFYSANSDSSVKIGVGWQGPYLRLAAGPTFIRDGWGYSFHAYDSNGNLLSTYGTPISQISSWGADNNYDTAHVGTSNPATAGDTNGYDADVSLPFPNTISTNGGFVWTGMLYGQVTMNIGTDTVGSNTGNSSGSTPNLTYTAPSGTPLSAAVKIWVVYFGPDLTKSPNPIAEIVAVSTVTNTFPLASAPFTYTISSSNVSNVTIGPRVLRAYVLPAAVTTFNAAAVAQAYVVSPPLSITVTGGSQTVPSLVLPHYSP